MLRRGLACPSSTGRHRFPIRTIHQPDFRIESCVQAYRRLNGLHDDSLPSSGHFGGSASSSSMSRSSYSGIGTELVQEPHQVCRMRRPSADVPSEVHGTNSAPGHQYCALVCPQPREHPGHDLTPFVVGVRACGERCENSGSLDCSSVPCAVLAGDCARDGFGVRCRRRSRVLRGVGLEFVLLAKPGFRARPHRSCPPQSCSFGDRSVRNAASASFSNSVSVQW